MNVIIESSSDALANAVAAELACIAGAVAAAFYGVPAHVRAQTLARLDEPLTEVVAEFERRFTAYMADYNANHAHPYRWTYTGQPLVRDTPFSQTRRQQVRGRAWFGTSRQQFERCMYSPRPYRRPSKPALAGDL